MSSETLRYTPVQFGPYGNKNNRPSYLAPPVEASIPESMLPGELPFDTTLDREGVISTGDVPEIIPAFLGVRKIVAERRIARAQAKIESPSVMGHVAESILKGKGYGSLDNPLRPILLRDRIAANRLERITHRRRGKSMRSTNISNTYPHINRSTGQPRPPKLNGGEDRNLHSNERTHKRLGSGAESLDDKFKRVAFKRINDATPEKTQKLMAKRTKAVLKGEAIDRIVYERKKKKFFTNREKRIRAARRAASKSS